MTTASEAIELKRIVITKKGLGYGKEALLLMQDIAFQQFHTQRLYLGTKAENLRAQHTYKVTGFTPDEPDPCTHFHITVEDYRRQRSQALIAEDV